MSRESVLLNYGDFNRIDDGFIRVADVYGDESTIIQSARMSHMPLADGTWQQTKEDRTPDQDQGLIRYLIKHNHGSPFEQCAITFDIRLPIYVARQLMRYRVAKVNEYSQRYRPAIGLFHKTKVFRQQSTSNKQASSGYVSGERGEGYRETRCIPTTSRSDLQLYLRAREEDVLNDVQDFYDEMISLGVAREQARKILPVSTYTDIRFQIDARNLMNLLKQRLDPHAQKEIREYARVMHAAFMSWMPNVAQAFSDLVLRSVVLSENEAEGVRDLFRVLDGPSYAKNLRHSIEVLHGNKGIVPYSLRSWAALCKRILGVKDDR